MSDCPTVLQDFFQQEELQTELRIGLSEDLELLMVDLLYRSSPATGEAEARNCCCDVNKKRIEKFCLFTIANINHSERTKAMPARIHLEVSPEEGNCSSVMKFSLELVVYRGQETVEE